MQYLTKIKLKQINNLSDARFAAAEWLDTISFCFDRSHPRFVPPYQAREIITWVSGLDCVGEFGLQDADMINEVAALSGLQYVLVKATHPAMQLIRFPLICELDNPEETALVPAGVKPYAFELNYVREQNTEAVKNLCRQHKVWLHESSGQSSLAELYAMYEPYGISLPGGDETKAGIRDFDELRDSLEKLRAD